MPSCASSRPSASFTENLCILRALLRSTRQSSLPASQNPVLVYLRPITLAPLRVWRSLPSYTSRWPYRRISREYLRLDLCSAPRSLTRDATFVNSRVLTLRWPSMIITWRLWKLFMRYSSTSLPVSKRDMPKSLPLFVSSTPRLLLPSPKSHASSIGPRPWKSSREKALTWETKWAISRVPWSWLSARQSRRNMGPISSCWTSTRPKFGHSIPCQTLTTIDSPTLTIFSSADRRFALELSVVTILTW
mmetsp:Transcript_30650/g.89527  ORF Transcript_30650/g.89527 Transcript_30650/m.89527 type:complete len:247 (+) Transcript_30650:685-1425(+)